MGRGDIKECSFEHYSSIEGPASKDNGAAVFTRGTCISQLLFLPFESVSGVRTYVDHRRPLVFQTSRGQQQGVGSIEEQSLWPTSGNENIFSTCIFLTALS